MTHEHYDTNIHETYSKSLMEIRGFNKTNLSIVEMCNAVQETYTSIRWNTSYNQNYFKYNNNIQYLYSALSLEQFKALLQINETRKFYSDFKNFNTWLFNIWSQGNWFHSWCAAYDRWPYVLPLILGSPRSIFTVLCFLMSSHK